jgi:hypothetical protein
MTDSTTIDERPGADEQLAELHESNPWGRGTAPTSRSDRSSCRPPALAVHGAVALLAINVSRVLLAGDSDSALAIGITVLLAILVGASVISAMPRAKTSSLAVTLIVGIFVVAMAGLVALGPSLDDGEGGGAGFQYATGTPTSTVNVVAGPGLTFDGVHFDKNYDATQGIVQIDYTGATGHTLAPRPKFDGSLGTDAGHEAQRKIDPAPTRSTAPCPVTQPRAWRAR